MSLRHALEIIKRNGGEVNEEEIIIKLQEPKPVGLEVGFEGHFPVERRPLIGKDGRRMQIKENGEIEFEGIGFAVVGEVQKSGEEDYTFKVEMYIDDELVETSKLPSSFKTRKPTPFWRYQLEKGKHKVRLKILNPSDKATLVLNNLIIYDDKAVKPKY
jgi:hypothetical protein